MPGIISKCQVLASRAVERSVCCRLIASFIISTWSETATTSYETIATFRSFAQTFGPVGHMFFHRIDFANGANSLSAPWGRGSMNWALETNTWGRSLPKHLDEHVNVIFFPVFSPIFPPKSSSPGVTGHPQEVPGRWHEGPAAGRFHDPWTVAGSADHVEWSEALHQRPQQEPLRATQFLPNTKGPITVGGSSPKIKVERSNTWCLTSKKLGFTNNQQGCNMI